MPVEGSIYQQEGSDIAAGLDADERGCLRPEREAAADHDVRLRPRRFRPKRLQLWRRYRWGATALASLDPAGAPESPRPARPTSPSVPARAGGTANPSPRRSRPANPTAGRESEPSSTCFPRQSLRTSCLARRRAAVCVTTPARRKGGLLVATAVSPVWASLVAGISTTHAANRMEMMKRVCTGEPSSWRPSEPQRCDRRGHMPLTTRSLS